MSAMIVFGAVLFLAALVFIWGVAVYNRLVRLSNLKDEAWSGVDVQLKRRFDLVPNLVETVKGYASHEQDTFRGVTEARAAVSAAPTQAARMEAENVLTSTLGRLFAVAESYPELKANENFAELQRELSNLENELQMARRYYNGTVREFNAAIQLFPAVLISRSLGYKEAEFFSAEEEARSTPQVEFS